MIPGHTALQAQIRPMRPVFFMAINTKEFWGERQTLRTGMLPIHWYNYLNGHVSKPYGCFGISQYAE
jgi:hypothetical protein